MTNPLDFNPLNFNPQAAAPAPVPFAATKTGIASNTVKGLLGLVPLKENPWLKVAADIGQVITQAVGSIGLTSINESLKAFNSSQSQKDLFPKDIAPTGIFPDENLHTDFSNLIQPDVQVPAYLKPIFGDGDIKDVPQRVAESSALIKANPFAQKIGLDKHSVPLAFGAIAGNTALDLSGLGGEEGAISALTKETDPTIIKGMLSKLGLSDEVAAQVAPHIAAVSRSKDVKNILDVAKAMHGLEAISAGAKAETEAAAQGTSQFPDEPPFPSETAVQSPRKITPEEFQASQENDGNGVPIIPKPTTAEEAATRYYNQKLAPDVAAGNPVSIGADDLKDHFGDYDLANHKIYSKAANDLVMKVAEESTAKKVIMMAGGPASGKTEVINGLKGSTDAGVIYDSNLSSVEGAKKQIEQLRAMGKEPEVHMVVQDPAAAYGFSKAREAAGGHPITDTAFVRNHAVVPENVLALAKEGVPVYVADMRRFSSRDEIAKALSENNLYVNEPIDVLEKLGYNEEYNRGVINNYNEKRTIEAEVNAGDGGRDVSGERSPRTNQGQEDNDALAGRKVFRSEEEAQQAIKDTPETARTPALQLAAIDSGKDGASWSSLVKGFVGGLDETQKVHALDYLGTPEFVLEKIGMGKGAEMLQDAKNLYRKNLKTEVGTIESWRKRVGKDPLASTRIFRYLDGQAKEVHHEMSNVELAVADEIKPYLKEWADRLKLPEDNRLSNYITHIFDDSDVEDKANPFEEDPELASIMSEKVAGSVYDPFTQKRLGKKGYKEDVWAALDAYVKRGTRKEAMDPALEYLKNESKNLDDSSYRYVKNLTHRINMRPTEMDKLFDNLITQTPGLKKLAKGPRPTMFLTQKIRNIFYRGTLGLNFGSALRNLSQGANTYAKLGEKYTTIGYAKMFTHLLTNNFNELKEAGVLSDELVQDKKVGVYKSLLQKADPVLFGLFDIGEKINRGSAFYGAKSKALAKGLSEAEATKYASRMVRETQFAFGNVDSPVLLSSDVVKTLTQLGTYNVKQIEFLTRMAKNKEFAGLARYTIASLAFVATIGKMFGMTVSQLVPSIGLGGSPVGNIATGIGELMSTNSETKAQGATDLKRAAVSVIPFGAQIKKSVGGLAAYEKGRDTTPAGKTRYKIPKTTRNLVQSVVFGKNSLPEAQAYYKKLDAPKKKKKAVTNRNPLD